MPAADDVPTPSLTVLVTGGRGFIGSRIVAALLERGHRVRVLSRNDIAATADDRIAYLSLDLAEANDQHAFNNALQGIDAVVNCAGILRETGRDRFQALHADMPAALAAAAVERGIRRFVQVSALGDPADGEFIASKHAGDARIAERIPESLILRPSLVYSPTGSYGGTSLLRSLAALPVLPLPAGGKQAVQPIAAEDLARLVCAALETAPMPRPVPYEVGGTAAMALRDYLLAIRHWLGIRDQRTCSVPAWLAAIGARFGEWSGRGPLGMTMWRMLQRGNACNPLSMQRLKDDFGFNPESLATTLASAPAGSADRWHARLYPLSPLLRVVLAVTWIASGTVGLLLPTETVDAMNQAAGFGVALGGWLALATCIVDILLGAWLLVSRRPGVVLSLMLLFVLGYTLVIGFLLPGYWLDPFGGLLKNGVIAIAILIAMATSDRS